MAKIARSFGHSECIMVDNQICISDSKLTLSHKYFFYLDVSDEVKFDFSTVNEEIDVTNSKMKPDLTKVPESKHSAK